MENSALLEERQARIAKAVALEKPDRTPVVLEMSAFAAKVVGMPLSKFATSSLTSAEAMINAFEKIGPADGVDYCSFYPAALSVGWLSKVQLPGRELPDNTLWQVHEAELMTREDYEKIVEEGPLNWMMSFIAQNIDPELFPKIMADGKDLPRILEMWAEKGIPALSGGGAARIPFEALCGARSFSKFIRDLYKIPDRVQAAFDAMLPFINARAIQVTKQAGLNFLWVGGWRSASSMLSPPLWDRFVFPYLEKVINELIDAGIKPILHFDSDWTRDLDRFKVFPKGKCILELDGMTNIFKAKEVLGDTMCIMGDVPPALLTLGTPNDVHNYCQKLIQEIGPEGFILHSGCDIPVDAKLENVQAMVAAATGK